MKLHLRQLPTLAELAQTRRAVQKGSLGTRLDAKLSKDKADAKRWEQVKREVWKRDAFKCVYCTKPVIKSLERLPNRGEVHHVRGRNVTPEDRYRVDSLVLLCALCHSLAQQHKIQIRNPRGTAKGGRKKKLG